MPFRSDRQRRFIYAKAGEGKAWARKFIEDSGHTAPPERDPRKRLAKALRGPARKR